MSDVPVETLLRVLTLLAIHILANVFSQCCFLHIASPSTSFLLASVSAKQNGKELVGLAN